MLDESEEAMAATLPSRRPRAAHPHGRDEGVGAAAAEQPVRRRVGGVGDLHLDGTLEGGPQEEVSAGVGVAAKYADGGRLLELRRFVLCDEAPRNSESRALSVMFRELRRAGYTRILSYADPMHGHTGIIYKATGFEYRGRTAARKHIMWKGKKYPDRNVHQVNFPYHLQLRAALASGEATRVRIEPKHIYVKKL